jgi:hypothetical protein
MKTIFLSILCLTTFVSQSQTAIIAHKSHSGTTADFFIDPAGNFGEPGPQLIQVVRLNDSTYVHVMSEFSGFIYHDTIRYNSQTEKYPDSLYEREKDYIELINFKNSPDSLKVKTPTQRHQELQIEPQQEATPKKKKKSYLLFLFGITGGGMLLMRLFSRILTPQVIS